MDRVKVLSGHLCSQVTSQQEQQLARQATSAPENNSSPSGPLQQGYVVTLPEKLSDGGDWTVRRSAASPYKLISSYPEPDSDVRTLHDNLERSIGRFPHVPFLGSRKRDDKGKLGAYQWMTYAQAGDVRTSIGSGLLQLGLNTKSSIGLYSVNCKEWVLVDCALHAYNFVSVPLYDTLGPDAVEYICNHAELTAVACSMAVVPIMLQALSKCPTVRVLIVYGSTGGRLPEAPAGSSCRVVSLEQVESLGRRHPRAHMPPKPSDLATLCYTSGTTGVPKGAMLTHGNLIASSAGTCTILTNWNPGDRHICYLPLAHIYERVNLVTCIHVGAGVGFYSGNVLELLDDVATLKPHIFVSVPRLWNRIYDRVMAQVRSSGPVARALFERAYAYKKACLERGDPEGGRWGRFYDLLIFSKIRAKLGGEVKYMSTGASPISDEVMTFLRVCFGASVLEGYGMTESSSAMSLTRADDYTTGHVGAPLPCGEIKLVDIPDMNYMGTDKPFPRGEVCVRGPAVFVGYYKDAQQTADVLDSDGWLHTGDVGMWLPGGRLKIIDRKKSMFKLAQGEYIAPEKVENVYMRSPFVAQVFVYGDSLRAQLVSIVVPDPEVLLPWAKERNLGNNMAELCNNAHVREAVLRSMAEEARVAQLRGFEQIQAIHLHPDLFTVENGLLTPTFKLKRPQAKVAFQAAIDAMYAALPNSSTA